MKKLFFPFLALMLLLFTACPSPDPGTDNPIIPPVSFNYDVSVETVPPVANVSFTFTGSSSDTGVEIRFNAQQTVPGYLFDHWEGDLSGNLNPAYLSAKGDVTVIAVYVKAYLLELTVTPSLLDTGAISFTPSGYATGPAGIIFPENTTVNLTAAPLYQDFLFDKWEGDLSGTANTVSLVMDADKTVNAAYVDINVNALNIVNKIAQEVANEKASGVYTDEYIDDPDLLGVYTIPGPSGGNCVYTIYFNPGNSEFTRTWDFNDYQDGDGNLINTGTEVFTLSQITTDVSATLSGDISLVDVYTHSFTMAYNYSYSKSAGQIILIGDNPASGTCVINDIAYNHLYAPE